MFQNQGWPCTAARDCGAHEGFPKLGGTVCGVPLNKEYSIAEYGIAFEGLYWVPLVLETTM